MGLLWLTRKSEERGLGDRSRGLARDELPLPIAPLIASLTGSLRVWEMLACEGRTGGRKGPGLLLGGKVHHSFFSAFGIKEGS